MSSDSEVSGPSPLPSPIFARCSPARSTVARKCREFFLKRLERTSSMQKRWSICDVPQDLETPCDDNTQTTDDKSPTTDDNTPPCTNAEASDNTTSQEYSETFEGYPLRKCRSSFDIAMMSLRKEISSLISQDNDLFRQMLSIHDSIAELRERQRHSACFDDDDDYDDDGDDVDIDECTSHHTSMNRHSHTPSLDSLSDTCEGPETSPESTLSSRSSHSADSADFKPRLKHSCSNHHRNRYRKNDSCKQRHSKNSKNDSRPLIFIDKSEICFRCRKMAPPYRRSSSITSLYYLHEDMESYDSGIHLHGSHSDSDHEIFV